MPTAIDVSSVVGLVAVGLFTAQILLGLLLSVGYNPVRRWPRRRLKLFTLHNWIGYIGLATACTHPLILLTSSTAGFRFIDIPRETLAEFLAKAFVFTLRPAPARRGGG